MRFLKPIRTNCEQQDIMIAPAEAEDLEKISSRSSSQRSQSNTNVEHFDSLSSSSSSTPNSMFFDIFFLFVGKQQLELELGTKKRICDRYEIKSKSFWKIQKKARFFEPTHIPILCGIIKKAKFDFWNYFIKFAIQKDSKRVSLQRFEKFGEEERTKIVGKELLNDIIERLEQKFGFQTITLKPFLVNTKTRRYNKISFTLNDLTVFEPKTGSQAQREEATVRLWIEMKGFTLPESETEKPQPKLPNDGKKDSSDQNEEDCVEEESKKQKAHRPKKDPDVPAPPKRITPSKPQAGQPAANQSPRGLSPQEQEMTRIRKILHTFNNSEEGVEIALRFVANGFGMDIREAIRVLLLHTGKKEFVTLEDMFKILAMHSMVLEAAKGK